MSVAIYQFIRRWNDVVICRLLQNSNDQWLRSIRWSKREQWSYWGKKSANGSNFKHTLSIYWGNTDLTYNNIIRLENSKKWEHVDPGTPSCKPPEEEQVHANWVQIPIQSTGMTNRTICLTKDRLTADWFPMKMCRVCNTLRLHYSSTEDQGRWCVKFQPIDSFQ